MLKEKLASTLILVYPDKNKGFHVHINSFGITLGAILAQPGEGNLDHPIYFASRKLSTTKKKYTNTEQEALAMMYSLKKLRDYL